MPATQKTTSKVRRPSKKAAGLKLKELGRLREQAALMNEVFESMMLRLAARLTRHAPRRPLPEYAKVVAVGAEGLAAELRGRTGIVLDAAEEEGRWTYTVYFPTRQETFVLDEASLWDTGETVPYDVIYGGGEARRVRVDAQGNGAVAG